MRKFQLPSDSLRSSKNLKFKSIFFLWNRWNNANSANPLSLAEILMLVSLFSTYLN